MKKYLIGAGLLGLLVISQSATAKTLEDVLKGKGGITEEDYKAVTKSRPLDYKPVKDFTLTSTDENIQPNFGNYLQTRYSFTDLEVNSPTAPDASKFEMKALKLTLNGYAYNKNLTYAIQTNFVRVGATKIIEQGYMNYRFMDEVQILWDLEQSAKPLLSIGADYYLNTLKATYTPASETTKASTTLETNNSDLSQSALCRIIAISGRVC